MMHPQIKQVISKLVFTAEPDTPVKVKMTLTSLEQTPLGNILNAIYYKTNITDLFSHTELSGSPHNGGTHTFVFNGTCLDAVALLELTRETLTNRYRPGDETWKVLNELAYVAQEILKGRSEIHLL